MTQHTQGEWYANEIIVSYGQGKRFALKQADTRVFEYVEKIADLKKELDFARSTRDAQGDVLSEEAFKLRQVNAKLLEHLQNALILIENIYPNKASNIRAAIASAAIASKSCLC